MTAVDKTNPPPAFKHFDQLPNSAFVGIDTVCWLLDCSAAMVWKMARENRWPKPTKIGVQLRGWNVGEVRAAMLAMREQQDAVLQ